MPAILLLFFASIQTAAVFLARGAALTAAQEAVTAQRLYDAPPGAGVERAETFLGQADDWLVDPQVQQGPGAGVLEVSFTVTGEALSIIPGFEFSVSQTARGTVERFTTDDDPPVE